MTGFDFCSKWSTADQQHHYNDVIMGMMASQITSLTIVYSTVYSGADQRKHQSSASLAFVRGINRGPVNSPHKWSVTWKMFPFHDVIMLWHGLNWYQLQQVNMVVADDLAPHRWWMLHDKLHTYFTIHRGAIMMTSSNGNILRVTGPLCGEFTGHRRMPLTKASNAELWCFLSYAPE